MNLEKTVTILGIILIILTVLIAQTVVENKEILLQGNTIAKCKMTEYANDINSNTSQVLFNCPFQINESKET